MTNNMALPATDNFVICCDLDAFFYQVECLRDPSLRDKPVAVQQHSDIICANHQAKAAGVRKHMTAAECRTLLARHGGCNVHVHLEPGGRVSYRPYQEASAAFFRLLCSLPWAEVVEKGSIDEAFISPVASVAGATDAPADAGAAAALALQLRERVQRELGLSVSVGVARNKLMAKLASRMAKPPAGGLHVAWSGAEMEAVLAACPAARLPGLGSKAAALRALGVHSAIDLRRFSVDHLERALDLRPAVAAQVVDWCRGRDASPVVDRGPPQSLSVQMTLTPVALPMPAAWGTVPVGGGPAGQLTPLVTGAADFVLRCAQLVAAMGEDLLRRVNQDRLEEGRWPGKAGVQVRAMGGGRDHSVTGRSAAFPPCSLDPGALHAALQRLLERLMAEAAGGYPSGCKVVELRLVADRFAALDASAAPITRFFQAAGAAAAAPLEQEQGVRPARDFAEAAAAKVETAGLATGATGAAPSSAITHEDPIVHSRGDASAKCDAEPSGAAHQADESDVDLADVDLDEQRRLLEEIGRRNRAQGAGGSAAGKRKGTPAGKQPGWKQPKIAGFFSSAARKTG